jgi:hypothetical protein
MSQAQVTYHHNLDPNRGLATAGIFFLKLLLALPHLFVVNALNSLAFVVSYIGYWIVAFTGRMPQMTTAFVPMILRWNARTYGWIAGLDDAYPPLDTDPQYSISVDVPTNESPSKGWAVAGLLWVPKVVAAVPHLVVMAVLSIAALLATWFGYIVVAFTGSYPGGIQDFAAGVMQWNLRVAAWFAGFTDEYPPFALDAEPSA